MDNEINRLTTRELNNLIDCSSSINNLVKRGFVSKRFGEYLNELCLLDFISLESVTFSQQGDIWRAGESLSNGRLSLDRIASIYFNSSFLKNGIPDYYRSLFDLAKERYKESVDKCVKILESLR